MREVTAVPGRSALARVEGKAATAAGDRRARLSAGVSLLPPVLCARRPPPGEANEDDVLAQPSPSSVFSLQWLIRGGAVVWLSPFHTWLH